jgi:hypothetical protein
MIILDTSVLSAIMAVEPNEVVTSWLDRQARTSVWTTSVTIFEIRYGLEILPASRRRSALEDGLVRVVGEKLEGRVLVFDEAAAGAAGLLMARRHLSGRPRELRDTMIAGIALAHRGILATRNMKHFDDLDVQVVDPWQDG